MVFKLNDPKACFCVECKFGTLKGSSKLSCQMFLCEVSKKPIPCTHARQQAQLCGPEGRFYVRRPSD
jgi:hypothetical protein